jgi:hypothetical protein
VGWGSPFLLVPEATTVDQSTMEKLMSAKEADLYLSNISPLGVPFNNLRGNSKDLEKMKKAANGRPGSPCPKEFLALNSEFSTKTMCTASRQYQRNKIKELDKEVLSEPEYKSRFEKIVEKSCLCLGLGAAILQVNELDTETDNKAVSICPGPNMAYFSKIMSLKEMTDHIYGRINVISDTSRPNMFMKELKLYIDYLKSKIEETQGMVNKKQEKYLLSFSTNLKDGVAYYQNLFLEMKNKFEETKISILSDLEQHIYAIDLLELKITTFLAPSNPAE